MPLHFTHSVNLPKDGQNRPQSFVSTPCPLWQKEQHFSHLKWDVHPKYSIDSSSHCLFNFPTGASVALVLLFCRIRRLPPVAAVTRGRFFGGSGGGIRNEIDLRMERRKSPLSFSLSSSHSDRSVHPHLISRSTFRLDGQSARDKPRFRTYQIV